MGLSHPRMPFRHPGIFRTNRTSSPTPGRSRDRPWARSSVPGLGRVWYVTEIARRVVIAEDEALIRLDLKEMLEEEGYQVVGEAGDGEAAVKLAFELRPDLVILDVKMPILDGISASEQITADRIAPVII